MRGRVLTWVLLALSAGGIHLSQRTLSKSFHQLKATSDVYPLPSPEQTVVLSLGYRAALADLIYGHLLVSYGIHFQERRLLEFAGSYLRTINELDPKFREPYMFADTLLVLQPKPPPQEHYRAAREILLRGTRERPYDTQLWMSAGQYLAYLGRPQLKDKAERKRWQLEGAKLMARACELVSHDENVPRGCLNAAGILNRTGQHDANIRFLRRFLAVTDDPELRRQAELHLQRAREKQGAEVRELSSKRLEDYRRERLGFISKDMALVVGPWFDPARCVSGSSEELECASSWRQWAHSQPQ